LKRRRDIKKRIKRKINNGKLEGMGRGSIYIKKVLKITLLNINVVY